MMFQSGEQYSSAADCIDNSNGKRDSKQYEDPLLADRLAGAPLFCISFPGNIEGNAFFHRLHRSSRQKCQNTGAAQEIQDGRVSAFSGFDLLEFELFSPGNDGTPDQLIGQD